MWVPVALVALAVSASWIWQLATHWDRPPESRGAAALPIPITPRIWHVAILSGVFAGAAVALFAFLVLR